MRSVAAVYENGVFRPKMPVDLPEGTEVALLLPEQKAEKSPAQIMKERYPKSFGSFPTEDAEDMAGHIREEFEKVEDEFWK